MSEVQQAIHQLEDLVRDWSDSFAPDPLPIELGELANEIELIINEWSE